MSATRRDLTAFAVPGVSRLDEPVPSVFFVYGAVQMGSSDRMNFLTSPPPERLAPGVGATPGRHGRAARAHPARRIWCRDGACL